jgi:hypothetical protein
MTLRKCVSNFEDYSDRGFQQAGTTTEIVNKSLK